MMRSSRPPDKISARSGITGLSPWWRHELAKVGVHNYFLAPVRCSGRTTGGAGNLRQDPINLIDTPVGMIAARYNVGAETRLTQRALVQSDDKEDLYYIFDFITPAPPKGSLDQDPATRKVVDLFSRVVESI